MISFETWKELHVLPAKEAKAKKQNVLSSTLKIGQRGYLDHVNSAFVIDLKTQKCFLKDTWPYFACQKDATHPIEVERRSNGYHVYLQSGSESRFLWWTWQVKFKTLWSSIRSFFWLSDDTVVYPTSVWLCPADAPGIHYGHVRDEFLSFAIKSPIYTHWMHHVCRQELGKETEMVLGSRLGRDLVKLLESYMDGIRHSEWIDVKSVCRHTSGKCYVSQCSGTFRLNDIYHDQHVFLRIVNGFITVKCAKNLVQRITEIQQVTSDLLAIDKLELTD